MSRSDLFMSAVYSAIADQTIPLIGGFGNGVDREGSRYIDRILSMYPVLNDYMNGTRSIDNAWERYSRFISR